MRHGQWVRDPETRELGQLISLRKTMWHQVKRMLPGAAIGLMGGLFGLVIAMRLTGQL